MRKRAGFSFACETPKSPESRAWGSGLLRLANVGYVFGVGVTRTRRVPRPRRQYAFRCRRLSARDLEALEWIGEGYEIAQYQLAPIFGDRSPTVASRFVCRSVARGLIVSERMNGVGMNRLRLTERGAEVLAGTARRTERLFVPRRPTAAKDLAHTLRINDVRVVLRERRRPPSELLPAWALQRIAWSNVIPDLLALWRTAAEEVTFTLACEIDLATERLKTVFFPKLAGLDRVLREKAGKNAAILVLTQGERRAELVRQFAESELAAPVIAETMPHLFGTIGLEQLRARLAE